MHVLPCFTEVLLTAQMIFAGLLFGVVLHISHVAKEVKFVCFSESWSGQIGIDQYFPVHQTLMVFLLI